MNIITLEINILMARPPITRASLAKARKLHMQFDPSSNKTIYNKWDKLLKNCRQIIL